MCIAAQKDIKVTSNKRSSGRSLHAGGSSLIPKIGLKKPGPLLQAWSLLQRPREGDEGNLTQICLDSVEAKTRFSHAHTAAILLTTKQEMFNSI